MLEAGESGVLVKSESTRASTGLASAAIGEVDDMMAERILEMITSAIEIVFWLFVTLVR